MKRVRTKWVVGGFAASVLAFASLGQAAGTTCAGATVINPASLPYSDAANNTGAGDEFIGACGTGTGGQDVFWSFTPTVSGNYLIDADLIDGVLSVIEGGCAGTEIACVDSSFVGETANVVMTSGTEYIIVYDGWGASDTGAFTLTVEAAPTPPANDTCITATAVNSVPFSDLGVSMASATVDETNAFSDNPAGSGRDLYYLFTAPGDGTYIFTAGGPGDTVAVLGDTTGGCGALTTIAAVDGGLSGDAESASLAMLTGETVMFVPRHYSSSSTVDMDVTIDLIPPPSANDTCGSATVITTLVNVGDGFSDTVSTLGNTDTFDLSAGLGGSPDAWWTITSPTDITCSMTLSGPDAVLGILDGTCGTLNELTSIDNFNFSTEVISAFTFTGGTTYYIVAEGADASFAGTFELNMGVLPPPPANDLCASAEVLGASLPDTASGDATSASSEFSLDAGFGEEWGGGDVYYTFTPAATGRYQLDLVNGGSSDHDIFVMDASFCTTIQGGGTPYDPNLLTFYGLGLNIGDESFVTDELTGGSSYLIIVSAYDGSGQGTFDISVDGPVLAPANDECANAIAFGSSLPDTVSGDTSAANSEFSLDAGGGEEWGGGDVYYTFTPSATTGYRFELTNTSGGADHDVFVFDASFCTTIGGGGAPFDPNSLTFVALGLNVGDESFTTNLTASTPYLIVVSAYTTGEQGSFDLTVDGPVTIPANDQCTDALDLVLASASNGTTVDGNQDITGGGLGAPEVFYRFTAGAAGDYSFTVTPTSVGYDVMLALLVDDCNAISLFAGTGVVDDSGASARATTGGVETLTATMAAGESAILLVGGFGGSTGSFDVVVTSTASVSDWSVIE